MKDLDDTFRINTARINIRCRSPMADARRARPIQRTIFPLRLVREWSKAREGRGRGVVRRRIEIFAWALRRRCIGRSTGKRPKLAIEIFRSTGIFLPSASLQYLLHAVPSSDSASWNVNWYEGHGTRDTEREGSIARTARA